MKYLKFASLGFLVVATLSLLWFWGVFGNIFGYCGNCPSGAFCAQFVASPCRVIIGEIITYLFGFLFLAHLAVYFILKSKKNVKSKS